MIRSRALRQLLYMTYVFLLAGTVFYLLSLRLIDKETDRIVAYIMNGLVSGSAAMMSVYGFSLYVQRPEDHYILFFGLFCLFTTLRVPVLEGGPILLLFPLVSRRAVLLLRSVFTLGAGLCNCYLILELFGRRHVRRLQLLATFWLVIPTIIRNTFSFTGTPVDSVLGLIGGVPVLVSNVVIILCSGQMKRRITKLFAAATACSVLSYSLVMLGVPNFALVWAFLYLIVNVLLIADRYAKAMDAVEHSNETLETTVAERTSELQDAIIQLNEANVQVTASERQLKELVANISHDLKTPLTVVALNLEQLTDPEHSWDLEESQRLVAVAYNRTLDLQRLTRNLFDALRMEENQLICVSGWSSLSELLTEVYRRYADYTDSSGVTLALYYKEDMELWIDPEKIWSVFDNVINNSLRYTPEGGSITITAEAAEDGYARLIIRDTGSGIAAEHLSHIFDRYYKADPSRGKKSGDAGLGLYIVKGIVEEMGGRVSAASGPGEGMAVIVTLKSRSR